MKLQFTGIIRECSLYFLKCSGPKHARGGDYGTRKVDGGEGEGRDDIGMWKVDGGGGDSVVQKLEQLVAAVKKKTIDFQSEAEAFAQLKDSLKKMEDEKQTLEAKDKWLNAVKDDSCIKSKELGKAGNVEEKACIDKSSGR